MQFGEGKVAITISKITRPSVEVGKYEAVVHRVTMCRGSHAVMRWTDHGSDHGINWVVLSIARVTRGVGPDQDDEELVAEGLLGRH